MGGTWQSIEQFIQQLWYGFLSVLREIGNIIVNVIVWIAVNVIAPVLTATGIVIGAVTAIALFSPAVATALLGGIVEVVAGLGGIAVKLITATVETTVHLIDEIIDAFAIFIELINLEALMEIHEILWILSDDYRALIGQLFDEISKVSEELLGYGLALHFIFRNTRALSLSVKSAMGIEYDVGQAMWLTEFGEVLTKFNEKAHLYATDPEMLFYDLEEWADQHVANIGATYQQAQYNAVKGALIAIKNTARDTKEIKGRLDDLIFALPGQRENAIRAHTQPILWRIDKFQFEDYPSDQKRSREMILQNREDQRRSRERISSIEWKTETPSRTITPPASMTDEERNAEYEKIEDITSKKYQDDSDRFIDESEKELEERKKEKKIEEVILPPPSWEAIKEKETFVVEMVKSKHRTSPFVGDY